MPRNNSAKYIDFADGDILFESNLDALQEYFADEFDGTIFDAIGDGVVTNTSWLVSNNVPVNNAVIVSSGTGYLAGQRFVAASNTTIASLTNTSYKVYAQAGGASFSVPSNAWPISFGVTASTVPSGAMKLADVVVAGGSVTSITDSRFIIENQSLMSSAIDDSLTPAPTANSVRTRLGHLASRIRELIDPTGSWTDSVPISLASLWGKFDPTTGHQHTGAAGDGPKLSASNIIVTPYDGISSTNVQDALEELDTDKLDKAGGTMTGALTLDYEISDGSHAITRDYAEKIIGTGPNYEYATMATNIAIDTNWTTLASVGITTTSPGGAIYMFSETGLVFLGEFISSLERTVTFRYRRGSTTIKETTATLSNDQTTLFSEAIGIISIPEYIDDSRVGNPGNYTYHLQVKIDFADGWRVATSFIPGRFNLIEFK